MADTHREIGDYIPIVGAYIEGLSHSKWTRGRQNDSAGI